MNTDKKKKGIFGGLFKGKKGRKKSDDGFHVSKPTKHNALHSMADSEQEI